MSYQARRTGTAFLFPQWDTGLLSIITKTGIGVILTGVSGPPLSIRRVLLMPITFPSAVITKVWKTNIGVPGIMDTIFVPYMGMRLHYPVVHDHK